MKIDPYCDVLRRPGCELTKGRNIQLSAVRVYSRCARGAVFRDIEKFDNNILGLTEVTTDTTDITDHN